MFCGHNLYRRPEAVFRYRKVWSFLKKFRRESFLSLTAMPMYLGVRLRLRVLARHVIRAARRVFGIPDFRLYALADGIKHCLFGRSQGLRNTASPLILRMAQLYLFNP